MIFLPLLHSVVHKKLHYYLNKLHFSIVPCYQGDCCGANSLAACHVEFALKGQDAPSCPVSIAWIWCGVYSVIPFFNTQRGTGSPSTLVLDAAINLDLLLPVPVPVWPYLDQLAYDLTLIWWHPVCHLGVLCDLSFCMLHADCNNKNTCYDYRSPSWKKGGGGFCSLVYAHSLMTVRVWWPSPPSVIICVISKCRSVCEEIFLPTSLLIANRFMYSYSVEVYGVSFS